MRTLWSAHFFYDVINPIMNLSSFRKDIGAKKPHFLLLGHPVAHSWSPLMHNTALKYYGAEARYYAVDLHSSELTELATFFNFDTFLGANVTVPYKQLIGDYLDHIDQSALEIGAVNTIVKDGCRLEGFNTDIYGFLSPLRDMEIELADQNAIVFGTGGASKAIVAGLLEFGIREIYLVSRNPGKVTAFENSDSVRVVAYHEWTTWAENAYIIINATPLGMHPKVKKSPVRDTEKQFLADRICYDIVYNPLKTEFLRQAESVNAQTIGGLEMLIQQGSRSFELWTGKSFPLEIVREKLYENIRD
jgi:shikimate dehydrogenase